MRRSISAVLLALAAGAAAVSGPAASAATTAPAVGPAPSPHGDFGLRLVDVPVAEADNPRARSYIIDFLPTRTTIHRRIEIVNQERRKATFTVYADAARIVDGHFVGDSGATRNELTGWISLQHRTVTLAPGASALDMVTIRVPKGATRGEHYGVVWVQQTAARRAGGGVSILEVARVGLRVYLAVGAGGVPPTSFDITSISGRRTAAGQPLIVVHVSNTGARAIDVGGTARLADGPGGTSSGPFLAQQVVTLAPGQSWNVDFAPPRRLPDGAWRATVALASGMTTASASATIQLPVVAAAAGTSAGRWLGLGFGGLIVAVALVMGGYAWQQRRRRAVPA